MNRTRSVASTGLFDFSMWSWCTQQSYNSTETVQAYLNQMDAFEKEFPGMRFILMTGVNSGGLQEPLLGNNQLVRNFAAANGKVLFDVADIETHDPLGNYHADSTDACPWCDSYCAAHPSDCANLQPDCAHSHPLICKMKAEAFWWMMARLAGWDGN